MSGRRADDGTSAAPFGGPDRDGCPAADRSAASAAVRALRRCPSPRRASLAVSLPRWPASAGQSTSISARGRPHAAKATAVAASAARAMECRGTAALSTWPVGRQFTSQSGLSLAKASHKVCRLVWHASLTGGSSHRSQDLRSLPFAGSLQSMWHFQFSQVQVDSFEPRPGHRFALAWSKKKLSPGLSHCAMPCASSSLHPS
mmetsp:Transcript_113117/g.316108  ORF Transcript_113117/g.316108 Transcript_113117/m.316108 type:complete len:202 (-) Transcript_113117:163-768(-)